MMTKKEIIDAITDGNWEIKHAENCNCSFAFRIEGDMIVEDVDGDECWESNSLTIDGELTMEGEMIAEHVRYESRNVLTDAITEDDIPEDIWDDMAMSDVVEQGDSPDCDAHEIARKSTLIEWLDKMVTDGYRLMRDNERGFANEYTVLLVSPDADADDIDDDWDTLSTEDWADEYLYAGDAATTAHNSVRVISQDL